MPHQPPGSEEQGVETQPSKGLDAEGAEAAAFSAPTARSRFGLLRSRFDPVEILWRTVFGYDFFISYAHADAEDYASALHEDLAGTHRCFLDEEELDVGLGLTPAIARALRRTSILVVLHTPGADASPWVRQEVTLFSETGRRVIFVDLGGAPRTEPRSLLAGRPEELKRVNEGADRLARGPSERSVNEIRRSLAGVRVETRRLVVSVSVAVVSLLLAAVAWRFAVLEQRAKEEAKAEAVAARRQTAHRLAVQADERHRGRPEEGLALALQAVHTYHDHGDPLVPEALASLQRAVLSTAGGRPLAPPAPDLADLVVSGDGRWVVTLHDDGAVRLGPAGAAELELVEPPAGVLADGEGWGERVAKVAWSRDGARLVVARRTNARRWPGNAVLSVHPVDELGVAGVPDVVQPFEAESWDRVELLLSGDGRWMSWGGGGFDVWLRATDGAGPAIHVDTHDAGQVARGFSPDDLTFAVVARGGLRRWRLARPVEGEGGRERPEPFGPRGAVEPLPQPVELESVSVPAVGAVALALGVHPERAAVLDDDGDVTYWNLSTAPPSSLELPAAFSAHREWFELFRLAPEDSRAALGFSLDGRWLLAGVTIGEDDDAFGAAAAVDVEAFEPAWIPLVHRRPAMATRSMSRIGSSGATQYKMYEGGPLGARELRSIVLGMGVVTLGFDGSLLLWELDPERARPRYVGVTSNVTSYVTDPWGAFLLVGGGDGTLRAWDLSELGDDRAPLFELIGHDAAVTAVGLSADGHRVWSVDAERVSRVWDRRHPSWRTDELEAFSPRIDVLVTERERGAFSFWDVDADPALRRPVDTAALVDAEAVAIDQREPWMVTWHELGDEPPAGELRLWSLDGARWSEPERTRRIQVPLGEGRAPLFAPSLRLFVDGERAWVELDWRNLGERRVLRVDVFGDGPPLEVGGDVVGWEQLSGHQPGGGVRDGALHDRRASLWIDEEGRLLGGERRSPESLPVDADLHAVAWSDDGDALALGDGQGRAWIVWPAAGEDLGVVREALVLDDSSRLAPPRTPLGSAAIDHLSVAVGTSWVGAVTADGAILLWHLDGEASPGVEPVVLHDRDAFAEVRAIHFASDGRRALLGSRSGREGQLLLLRPDELEVVARSWSVGRLHDVSSR